MAEFSNERIEELLAADNPYAKPRPEFKNADIDRALTPLPQSRESGPGVAASFLKGLAAEGPAQVGEFIGMGVDALGQLAVPGDRGTPGVGARIGSTARTVLGDLGGFEEPVSQAERTAQAAGAGTAIGLTAAPLAMAAAPSAAAGLGLAGLETLASAAGGAVAEEIRGNPTEPSVGREAGALGAELLLAAAAPGVVVSKAPDVITGVKNLRKAMEITPEISGAAKKLGVTPSDLVGGSSEFKRFVPEHASGDERYIREWSNALDDGISQFGPDEMPTTRQMIEALDGDAGSGLASLEEGIGTQSGNLRFDAKIAGRRRAAQKVLSEEAAALRPDGSPDQVSTAFEAVRQMRKDKVDELWGRIPEERMPPVDARPLKLGAEESRARAGEFDSDIPEEVAKVLEWPDEVPFSQYQLMRSRVERTNRIARKGNAETQTLHRADNLSPMRLAFNDALDEIGETAARVLGPEDAESYAKARAAARKYHDDFNATSVAVRSIEDFSEQRRVVGKILGAPKPAEEAARAMRVLDQSPGGADSFRRMFFDELVGGEDINPEMAKRSIAALRKNENAAREIFGDERFDSSIKLLDRVRIIGVGKTGRSAQTASVGSGRAPVDALVSGADAAINPAGRTSSIVFSAIQKALNSGAPRTRILMEAALDPKFAKLLLEMPTDRGIEAWILNWGKLNKRAALKVGVDETTRKKTGRRPQE